MAGSRAAAAPARRGRAHASAWARLRYRADSMLSKGILGVVAWLAAGTLVVAVLAGVFLTLVGAGGPESEGLGFVEATWMSLLRTLDPGTMGSDAGWPLRLTSLGVTMAGIFGVSALIGLVSSSIDQRIEQLRKGRSQVVETGHTLILGWSNKVFGVLAELVVANANQPDAAVVILADRDKMEMDDAVRSAFPDTGTTRVICRHGDSANLADLDLVSYADARSIIVLCPEDGGDAQVIRTVLALATNLANLSCGIVAEVSNSRNGIALRNATKGRVLTVSSGEVIGRITAQVCRQAGLGVVYQELLDFDGDELYFQPEPRLVGRTFVEAVLAYDASSVIGLRRAVGGITLNPPMDTVIQEGDALVAVSADDDTVVLPAGYEPTTPPACDATTPHAKPVERLLFLGWNDLGPLILGELEQHIAPGSRADVVIDDALYHGQAIEAPEGSAIELHVRTAAIHDSRWIAERLRTGGYDRAVILCYNSDEVAEADAYALLSLVQLRQAFSEMPPGWKAPTVVTELLEPRDVELARVSGADDFIVSDRLTSLMLAQLAENAELDAVFADLFDAHGSLICMRPVAEYVPVGVQTPYRDVVAAGCRRGEVVIGYRRPSADGAGVTVNPDKTAALLFEPGDEVIVLASQAAVAAPAAPAAAPAAAVLA